MFAARGKKKGRDRHRGAPVPETNVMLCFHEAEKYHFLSQSLNFLEISLGTACLLTMMPMVLSRKYGSEQ